MDRRSGSARREGWEVCGHEATQPSVQAGVTGEAEAATAEVGVLHSIVDLLALDADYREQLRHSAGREALVLKRASGVKDREIARQGYKLPRKFGSSQSRSMAKPMKRCDPTDPESRAGYGKSVCPIR